MKFIDMAHQFDLSFLEDAAGLVDTNLQRLELEAKRVEDPDQFGTFDKTEYILGFGLVACQTYITSCVGLTMWHVETSSPETARLNQRGAHPGCCLSKI